MSSKPSSAAGKKPARVTLKRLQELLDLGNNSLTVPGATLWFDVEDFYPRTRYFHPHEQTHCWFCKTPFPKGQPIKVRKVCFREYPGKDYFEVDTCYRFQQCYDLVAFRAAVNT